MWRYDPARRERLFRALEQWLVAALEAWRVTFPDTVLVPWDFYHFVGAAGRILSHRVPRDSLGVHYDLDPRSGKYPTSYTTFGARPVANAGRWGRAEPWIFTSYQTSGFEPPGVVVVGHAGTVG